MDNIFEQFDEKNPNNEENMGGEVKEINKSEIFASLKQYNNPLMVKKTGKEIKKHIQDVILPYLIEKSNEIKIKIDAYLENSPIRPLGKPYTRIELTEEEFPYKTFSWEETQYREKSVGNIFKGFGDVEPTENEGVEVEAENVIINPYYPISKEEAEGRCGYNCLVEDLRDLILDMKTANVLLKNLEDNQEYWLNLEQLTALKFDEDIPK